MALDIIQRTYDRLVLRQDRQVWLMLLLGVMAIVATFGVLHFAFDSYMVRVCTGAVSKNGNCVGSFFTRPASFFDRLFPVFIFALFWIICVPSAIQLLLTPSIEYEIQKSPPQLTIRHKWLLLKVAPVIVPFNQVEMNAMYLSFMLNDALVRTLPLGATRATSTTMLDLTPLTEEIQTFLGKDLAVPGMPSMAIQMAYLKQWLANVFPLVRLIHAPITILVNRLSKNQ